MKNYINYLCFRYRFNRLVVLLFIYIGNNFYLFASDQVHKAQSLIEQKKEQIVRLYERKRYAKANAQIELLLPMLKNRRDRSKFEWYQAYGNFYTKKYLVSSNQFHLFVKQYPTFPQVEEALFMKGYSLACEDVDIRLDQTVTYDAIRSLDHYLAVYPTGLYRSKAFDMLQTLQARLMKKSFQAAALYAQLRYYNAAIVALKNFQQVYPDSSYKEQVLRLLEKCYAQLAMQQSFNLVNE
ncbi:outer membrane protein assembly factor BamD [Cardinium endosymbiont of Bemisia tabaci]|uniref:outer membrane protein assembly factor BamD n=1 Tax=Cardinium endosymbiont of Bemisia tabaci TaxID=672794 RepID=UPI000442D368|nr:outer membrane protein assembly factor BamD [Cardinium endosymbiont of Bemisia tabaci]CDG49703.1 Outer membrane protein assembly factor BamD [Cardinium endosymbiont cBtQ1 of Bemisia tabaci]